MRIITFASNKHGRRGLLRSHEGKLRRENKIPKEETRSSDFITVVHMMCHEQSVDE
jgi:hypothetical protein